MRDFPRSSSGDEPRWRAPKAPVVRAVKIVIPELVARQMLPEAKREHLSLKDVALRHILRSMGLTVEVVEAYSRAPKAPDEKPLSWKGHGGYRLPNRAQTRPDEISDQSTPKRFQTGGEERAA
jgi:hypothetical protein